MTPEDGGPAFPTNEGYEKKEWANNETIYRPLEPKSGMSLRAYLAGKAIQGILSSITLDSTMFTGKDLVFYGGLDQAIAKASVMIADAIIKELAKESP